MSRGILPCRPRRLSLLSHSMSLSIVFLIHLLCLASPVLAYQKLSDAWLKDVPSGGDDFDVRDGSLLAPILITRVPGTPGQTKVQQHFVDYFSTQLPRWTIQWQNSTDKTPKTGDRDIPFQNLIIRREPPWTEPGQANYLTFAAHYDSKLEPEGFIGAIDSAAPCAMLMHMARAIDQRLTERYDKLNLHGGAGGTVSADMGVQILLLDGEEAFDRWTDTDSVYGSRSLSQEWENTFYPAMSTYQTPLDQISLFVLLDLLGSANPSVPSYFRTTHWAYQNMATIEKRMRDLGLLESTPNGPFLPDGDVDAKTLGTTYIGDDHEPFMRRGVPILHVIPAPFPEVWHTMDDDGDHLDMPTVQDWSKIVTAFAMEWLDLMELESGGEGGTV